MTDTQVFILLDAGQDTEFLGQFAEWDAAVQYAEHYAETAYKENIVLVLKDRFGQWYRGKGGPRP